MTFVEVTGGYKAKTHVVGVLINIRAGNHPLAISKGYILIHIYL
jgi:hypothetical protein